MDELNIAVATNGIGLNTRMTELFAKYNVHVQVSIDGGPELHNELRVFPSGQGSFSGVEKAIKELKVRGLSFTSRSTVTELNADILALFNVLSPLGFSSLNFQPVHGAKELEIDSQEETFVSSYQKVVEDKEIMKKVVYARAIWDRVERGLKINKFCGMGTAGLVIAPNGDVYPCHRLVGQEEFQAGNILRHVNLEKVKAIGKKLPVESFPQCSFCWARYLCGGGCYAENLFENGTFSAPYPLRCKLTRSMIKKAISLFVRRRRDFEKGIPVAGAEGMSC
ncbi:MAG: radical SAM protein [Firmicutes bacterium]|nr:radical SAM protein [Bacillota bacterium]